MNSSCADSMAPACVANAEAKVPAWHAGFVAMLPDICRHAKRYFRGLNPEAKEEAVNEVAASALIAYHRLVELGKVDLAYAAPLADYGCRQYCDGRRVGLRQNSKEVTSDHCQRRHHFAMVSTEEWRELADQRQSTPAEIAAVRVDFADWLETLTPRDRRLVKVLARGETTRRAARLFRVTAGRVSQLRRELSRKWHRFVGENDAEAVTAS